MSPLEGAHTYGRYTFSSSRKITFSIKMKTNKKNCHKNENFERLLGFFNQKEKGSPKNQITDYQGRPRMHWGIPQDGGKSMLLHEAMCFQKHVIFFIQREDKQLSLKIALLEMEIIPIISVHHSFNQQVCKILCKSIVCRSPLTSQWITSYHNVTDHQGRSCN